MEGGYSDSDSTTPHRTVPHRTVPHRTAQRRWHTQHCRTHGAVVVPGLDWLVVLVVVDAVDRDEVEFGFQPSNSTSFIAAASVPQSRDTTMLPPSQWNWVVTG